MEAIERALDHAMLAGKLRHFVRTNGGDGLGGLLKLADAHRERARALLDEVGEGPLENSPSPHAHPTGRARGCA